MKKEQRWTSRNIHILPGLAEEITHAVGDHSWFWSLERKGQNHLGSRMKEQTKGLRTHRKTVVLMRVERTDKKTFLRSSGSTPNCFLASLRISLPILLATNSTVFISLHSGRTAVLASRKWSETTGQRQGQGGRKGFVAPNCARQEG